MTKSYTDQDRRPPDFGVLDKISSMRFAFESPLIREPIKYPPAGPLQKVRSCIHHLPPHFGNLLHWQLPLRHDCNIVLLKACTVRTNDSTICFPVGRPAFPPSRTHALHSYVLRPRPCRIEANKINHLEFRYLKPDLTPSDSPGHQFEQPVWHVLPNFSIDKAAVEDVRVIHPLPPSCASRYIEARPWLCSSPCDIFSSLRMFSLRVVLRMLALGRGLR